MLFQILGDNVGQYNYKLHGIVRIKDGENALLKFVKI